MAAPLASTDAEPAALQSTDLETVPELEQVPTDEPAPPSTNPEIAAPPPDQTTSRPRTPPAKTPRQSGEGIEKTDWEVVNASPSHSPSKDADNQGAQKGKTKQRERETSGSSTGKIGQKIDGVKKVLKSGVFGGCESCHSRRRRRLELMPLHSVKPQVCTYRHDRPSHQDHHQTSCPLCASSHQAGCSYYYRYATPSRFSWHPQTHCAGREARHDGYEDDSRCSRHQDWYHRQSLGRRHYQAGHYHPSGQSRLGVNSPHRYNPVSPGQCSLAAEYHAWRADFWVDQVSSFVAHRRSNGEQDLDSSLNCSGHGWSAPGESSIYCSSSRSQEGS